MLRRDMQYVLTWDALEYCWLVRPVPRPLTGDQIGRGGTRVNIVDLQDGSLRETGD
jgi:hypothetical protein